MRHCILKSACAFLLIAAWVCPTRADILANENFADGAAHWRGDGHEGDGGLVINLDPNNWTKVSQTFNTRESRLQFNVTYTLSDDCSLAARAPRSLNLFLDETIFQQLTGVLCLPFHDTVAPASWMAFIFDPAARHFDSIYISTATPDDPKTGSGLLDNLVEHEEKILYLTFPPGTGSITLKNVSLGPLTVDGH
jgi:hypothetical protein